MSNNNNNSSPNWVIIVPVLVAVLSLIGVIATAIISSNNASNIANLELTKLALAPSQTIQAATVQAQLATATTVPTNTEIPSDTPTEAPSDTPTDTPTAINTLRPECLVSFVGPDDITAGSYAEQELTPEQRQWLWQLFGHEGQAPIDYGGEDCTNASGTLSELDDTLFKAHISAETNDSWESFTWLFEDDPAQVTMVLVPVGRFVMGVSGNGGEQYITKPFWIDETEVTRAEYQACVDDGLCNRVTPDAYSSRDNQPVNWVTWLNAFNYCNWRGDSYSLPSELEWEYVGRGPDGQTFPWKGGWSPYNLAFESYEDRSTANVGSFLRGASWVGALDMSGNVWEWTRSIYINYPYTPNDGRELSAIPESDVTLTIRGGSVVNPDEWSHRLTSRNGDYGVQQFGPGVGFRCMRIISNP